MITEFVFFQFPAGADRDQVLANYRTTADSWLKNPDLVQKYYFFDAETATGGGVYIWHSREDAARWHGDEYMARVTALYGVAPRIQIFDALLYVNPGTWRKSGILKQVGRCLLQRCGNLCLTAVSILETMSIMIKHDHRSLRETVSRKL